MKRKQQPPKFDVPPYKPYWERNPEQYRREQENMARNYVEQTRRKQIQALIQLGAMNDGSFWNRVIRAGLLVLSRQQRQLPGRDD